MIAPHKLYESFREWMEAFAKASWINKFILAIISFLATIVIVTPFLVHSFPDQMKEYGLFFILTPHAYCEIAYGKACGTINSASMSDHSNVVRQSSPTSISPAVPVPVLPFSLPSSHPDRDAFNLKDLKADLQAYLVQQLATDIVTRNLRNVTLTFSEEPSYRPGIGTAECTIDGGIDADGRTILPSNSYTKQSIGDKVDTMILEACHKAIDDMIYYYHHQ